MFSAANTPGVTSTDPKFLQEKRERDVNAHRASCKKNLHTMTFKKQFPYGDNKIRVVLRGDRGVGKSTLGALLKNYLEALGFPCEVSIKSTSKFETAHAQDSRQLCKASVVFEEV